MPLRRPFASGLALIACLLSISAAAAADVATAFPIAGGTLSLEAPEGFERVQPKSGMIEAEFAVHRFGLVAFAAPGHQHHAGAQSNQQRHGVPDGRAIGHIAAQRA